MRTSLPSIEKGVRYNHLTLTGNFEVRPKSHIYVECECQCGSVVFKRLSEIYKGTTKSCGAKTCKELSQKVEIAKGDRYGRLVLTGKDEMRVRVGDGSQLRRYVEADCDCGVRKFVLLSGLRNSNTQSCGCYHKDRILETKVTHGGTIGRNFHPTYATWCGIKQRCYNPNCEAYINYGGRGILICKEWLDDYLSFYNWSIGNEWQKGLSLDRKNNELGYCPSNCRWTTRQVQSRNKRSNKNLTVFGETKCVEDWANDNRCKVTKTTVHQRLKNGWDAEKALATPPTASSERNIKHKKLTAFGETKYMIDWLSDGRCKVKRTGLNKRLDRGWSAEDAISVTKVKTKLTQFKEYTNNDTVA